MTLSRSRLAEIKCIAREAIFELYGHGTRPLPYGNTPLSHRNRLIRYLERQAHELRLCSNHYKARLVLSEQIDNLRNNHKKTLKTEEKYGSCDSDCSDLDRINHLPKRPSVNESSQARKKKKTVCSQATLRRVSFFSLFSVCQALNTGSIELERSAPEPIPPLVPVVSRCVHSVKLQSTCLQVFVIQHSCSNYSHSNSFRSNSFRSSSSCYDFSFFHSSRSSSSRSDSVYFGGP
jgi:hypothetical protein